MTSVEDNSSNYVTIVPANYPETAEAGDTQELPRLEIDLDDEKKVPERDPCEIGLTLEQSQELSSILTLLLTQTFADVKKPCESFDI